MFVDVPYGSYERQALDVYLPQESGTAPIPVLVFFHGGYWVLGHKDTLGFMDPPITSAPDILVSGGYRPPQAPSTPTQ